MACVRYASGIVCIPDEVEPDAALDLRTRSGREAEVLAQVKRFGGFSVFWGTENRIRASAICRLETAGRIRRKRKQRGFPWCAYSLSRG